MLKIRVQQVLAFSCVILGTSLSGCGNVYQYAPVTGKVTCNGKPAVGGIVIFRPIDAPKQTNRPKGEPGPSCSGVVGEDGTFTLVVPAQGKDPSRKGAALIGPHEISFMFPPPTVAKTAEKVEKQEDVDGGEVDVPVETQEIASEFPPLDCSNVIAPASVEVKAGANSFDFTLQPGVPPDMSSPRAMRRARRMYSQNQSK